VELSKNAEKIAILEESLRKKHTEVVKLYDEVSSLEHSLKTKDADIATLKDSVKLSSSLIGLFFGSLPRLTNAQLDNHYGSARLRRKSLSRVSGRIARQTVVS
jgi:hypothetical protein